MVVHIASTTMTMINKATYLDTVGRDQATSSVDLAKEPPVVDPAQNTHLGGVNHKTRCMVI